MSATRDLVERLRIRLGESRPMSAPAPASHVQAPPKKVFAPQRPQQSAYAKLAEEHTTALVGIGQVGTRYATDVVLQFQAELAVAHGAVAEVLPDGWATENNFLSLQSRVADHHEFLLRPDLGRRLDDVSLERLKREGKSNIDVQPILADGLSAVATMGSGKTAIGAFMRECESLGLSVGTPVCARFARVWLQDEIGAAVNAKVAIIILGERPGLGTGDGLSAYIVHNPKIGNTDGDRNMMSNIHQRGTPPEQAAKRLALLAQTMIRQGTSGVNLDLTQLTGELAEFATRANREPQKRKRLVEVNR